MYKEIINNLKPNLEKITEKFKQDIGTLRTGQANPAMVENIMVECYGSRMPINQLAVITTSDARSLMIQPWDRSVIKEIEKAIASSARGLSAAVSGEQIRVSTPALSEETRKEMIKVLGQRVEEARISVRLAREGAWKQIQDQAQEGKIREDDKFRGKDELQKTIEEYNNKIKETSERKEKEIMTV